MMTAFVSRVWRHLWIGQPILNLDKTLFDHTLQKTKFVGLPYWQSLNDLPEKLKLQFVDFVDRTLMMRSKQYSNTTMASLKLFIPLFNKELSARVQNWFKLAINDFKVEELIFYNGSLRRPDPFELVFKTSLTAPTPARLKLKRLELGGTTLGPEIIECLSMHCPLMERLCFYKCNKLDKLRISGFSKLKEFVLRHDRNRGCEIELEINVPTLRFLEYHYYSGPGKIKADTVKCLLCLEDLRLCGVILRSHWCLPLLTNLLLNDCRLDTEDVVISARYLKTLCIRECSYSASVKIKIEAPSLECFNFSGDIPPLFQLHSSGQARVKFVWDVRHTEVLQQLVDFLSKINPCKEMEIEKHDWPKGMIIRPEVRHDWFSPLPDVKHMKLRLCNRRWSSNRVITRRLNIDIFLETLLWLSPCPLMITISLCVQFNQPEFKVLKFKYYKAGTKGAQKCSKCEFLAVRCWQHHLEEVNVENHRAGAKESAYWRRRKLRALEDNEIKAFFENAREKDKIIVNIFS